MTTPAEPVSPELIGPPPVPVRKDRMVQLWIGANTLSWLGDSAWTVALAWTAAHLLSPATAGVVIAVEMIPQAALVLVGGVIADRYDPRRVMIAGQLAKAAILLAGALAWRAEVLDAAPTLLLVGLAFGCASGLSMPAGPAFIRQLVAPDDLGTVSGWNQIGNRLARLLGAPLGGALVAWNGLVPAMAIDAASFLVLAAVMAFVVRVRYRMPRAEHARWRDTFVDGVHYLRSTPTALIFVTGLTALNVFVTPVVALGLALNVSDSGWGAAWVGIADAALAAGAIAGSAVAIKWQPEHLALAGFRGLVVQGSCLALVGIGWLPGVVVAMFGVGVTAGTASVWLSAAYLRAIAPSQIGRVSSVSNLGDMTLVPLAVPTLGALAAATSILTATVAFGVAGAALCLWFATRRTIRELV